MPPGSRDRSSRAPDLETEDLPALSLRGREVALPWIKSLPDIRRFRQNLLRWEYVHSLLQVILLRARSSQAQLPLQLPIDRSATRPNTAGPMPVGVTE